MTGLRCLLTAQGVGPLTLPLSPEAAAALAGVVQPAPYGRGSATLVDPAVRRCVQLEPAQLSLRNEEAWGAELGRVVAAAAEGLGLPPQALQVGACRGPEAPPLARRGTWRKGQAGRKVLPAPAGAG